MKKRSILPILFALALTGCDLISLDGFGGLSNLFNKPETQNNQNNNTQNNNQNSGNNSGQQTTGGGGSTTGGQVDMSKWSSEMAKYVTTITNNKLPAFVLNGSNKFNGYDLGPVEGSSIPYFNPYIKNTSPGINYEHEYEVILKNAGWTFIEKVYDSKEKMTDVYYYELGNLKLEYSKYKGDDNIYYFDVYVYNDYIAPLALNNSVLEINASILGITNKYADNANFSKTLTSSANSKSYKVTGDEIMRADTYSIQLKNNTGKLCVEGPSKGVAILISEYPQCLLVRYGSNKSNLQYAFNNGGIFEFPSANYIEITAVGHAIELEAVDILD